jgi:predicted acyltransferase
MWLCKKFLNSAFIKPKEMTTKSLHLEPEKRLYSLDALRGFDMFWITGGSYLIEVIARQSGASWMNPIVEQMEHVPWNGFHFYDLIFPLFMFISGVAIPFSLVSKLEKKVSKSSLAKKAIGRGLILVLLGWIYNGVFSNGFENPRLLSVLGQIGLGYMFAALITIYTKTLKQRMIWLGSILFAIGVLQLLVPVPGIGAGVLTPEGCINGYIDRMLVPGRLHGEVFDPEGLLCVVSAVSVTLMGSLAGYILRHKKTDEMQKVKILAVSGAAAIGVALLLSTFYPIIKACWTDSFNLLTSGIGFLLIALFYWIIDIKGWQKWSFFFRVIGMNSIFIYLFHRFFDAGNITRLLLGWTELFGEINELFLVAGEIMIVWLLMYYMYKKKIFLRV